jgi:hypothetical protein
MAVPEPRRPPRLRAGLVVFCLFTSGLQLWLAAPDEVVASANPYDQQRYVEMADQIRQGRWLGHYGPLTLARGPGYPLWLAAVSRSGVRLRTAAELLLAASATAFAWALLRAGAAAPTVGAAFAVLVLQPHAYLVNREALPAGFYLPVLLLALAGLLLAVSARRPVVRAAYAAGAGLAGGVLWVTRPETVLIPLLPLSAAAAELLLRRGDALSQRLRDAVLLLGAASGAAALVVAAIAELNQRHYGLRVVSERRAPGYVAAERALLRVEHTRPRRFVPVPRGARERAYAVSPSFRALRAQLEGPSWAREVSCVQSRVCRDLTAGVFPWILREAAAGAGRMPTARAADDFFQRVADEIDAACDAGGLPCRRAPPGLVPPDVGIWLPHLGESARRLLARIATPGGDADRRPPRDAPDLGRKVRALFDSVARRRIELTSDRWMELRGSAAPAEAIAGIDLVHGELRLALPLVTSSAGPGGAARVAFGLRYEQPAGIQPHGPRLEIARRDAPPVHLALAGLRGGPVERDGLRVEIARGESLAPSTPLRDAIRAALWTLHAQGIRVLAVAAVLAAGLAVLRRPRRGAAFGVALVLLAGVVGSRLLLLAVVDASSFPADTTRYLYPVISLSSCLLLLLVDAALPLRRRAR